MSLSVVSADFAPFPPGLHSEILLDSRPSGPRLDPVTKVLQTLRFWYILLDAFPIGIARGCTWCTCIPRAEKKGGDLQEKVVSAPPGRECTPEAEQESIF